MPTNPIRLTSAKYGLLYLPSFSQFYLFSVDVEQLHLWLGFFGLVAAVTQHGFFRAVSGPQTANDRLIWKEEWNKRVVTVVLEQRPPQEYTGNLIQDVKGTEIGPRGFLRIMFLSLSLLYGLILTLVSIHQLVDILGALNILGLSLLFGMIFSSLLTILWRPWGSAYLYRKNLKEDPNKDIHIAETVLNFERFFQERESPKELAATINVGGGGELQVEFISQYTASGEIAKDFELVGYAFCAFIERFDYPCQGLLSEFTTSDGEEGSFKIKAQSARQFMNGEMDYGTYWKELVESVEVSTGQIELKKGDPVPRPNRS